MLSSQKYIDGECKKSGRKGRFDYLQALVTEFQDTSKKDSKLQILANLANFAYDPINYDYLRQLNVIDLYLDVLSEEVESEMSCYSIAGLCNLALDPLNKEYIIKNDGFELIISCLSSSNEETVINGITTLMALLDKQNTKEVVNEEMLDCMKQLEASDNPRLKNLATIFIQDFGTSHSSFA